MYDDEKYRDFFKEFGELLNKYHFMVSAFELGSAIDERIFVIRFESHGKDIFPVYAIPEGVEPKKTKDE